MAYETKIRFFTLVNRTACVLFLKAGLQEKSAAGEGYRSGVESPQLKKIFSNDGHERSFPQQHLIKHNLLP
jgi:hypothetical protein